MSPWKAFYVIRAWSVALAMAVFCGSVFTCGQNQFSLAARQTNGWMQLNGNVLTNQLIVLQASSNLARWTTTAVLDYRLLNLANYQVESTNRTFQFLDPAAALNPYRFYRFLTTAFADTNDWKNQIQFPDDLFVASQCDPGGSCIHWVKLAILLSQPDRVYFQDSQKYVLHYDFASQRLAPFQGMDHTTFDQVSLFVTNQQVLLGTVLFPPLNELREYGIQFAGRDGYPREMVKQFFEVVRSAVMAPAGTTAFYFPAYEQTEAAAMDEAYLTTQGIRVSSPNRWLQGNQVYSVGWALGKIKFITASEINAAYADGRLSPQDILLTDGVPAEIPFVAGILSTAPATPNSHVAILANAYAIPFIYLADPLEKARGQQLVGKEVVLQASIKSEVGQMSLINIEGALDPAFRAALLALKTPAPANIPPKAVYGAFHVAIDDLTLDDVKYFGGKAANFGLLRRIVPTNSPVALAFSFDLWDAFMDQILASGKTLRADISNRLAGFTYPPNVASVRANLSAIRELITKPASFNAAQKQAITNGLAIFDPNRPIRFRSSSNAEDSKAFSAAGLYDSYSGCLLDDLDGDTQGPCHCHPAEPNERGVFRAMQKVYASFYNDNAFLERLRHAINESQVGMALLVHHSTPDEFELANGVATVSSISQMFGGVMIQVKSVTQAAAVSVTNPEGNAKPEIVMSDEFSSVQLAQASGLVPLGSYVMNWPDDYTALTEMLVRLYTAFRGSSTEPPLSAGQTRLLDFEYKKTQNGSLLLKQVRELPQAGATAGTRYLLNEPVSYWVYQSEGSEVFANHHMKGSLTLQTKNLALNAANLAECFYTDAHFVYRDGTNLLTLTGALSSWPEARHSVSQDPRKGDVVTDRWTVGDGAGKRIYQLTSVISTNSDPAAPFLPQAEIRKWLEVTYATPLPILDYQTIGTNTVQEEIQLVAHPDLSTLQPDPAETETFATTNHITFQVAFLSSTNTVGPPLGVDKNLWGTYPAAYSPWAHTTITGLLSEPLELRGYYSQSAKAGHKYRYQYYIYEPQLEPDLPAQQWQELKTKNIQLIWVERILGNVDKVSVIVLGYDGIFRRL